MTHHHLGGEMPDIEVVFVSESENYYPQGPSPAYFIYKHHPVLLAACFPVGLLANRVAGYLICRQTLLSNTRCNVCVCIVRVWVCM